MSSSCQSPKSDSGASSTHYSSSASLSSSYSGKGQAPTASASAKDPNVAMTARFVKKGEIVSGEVRNGKFVRDSKKVEGEREVGRNPKD